MSPLIDWAQTIFNSIYLTIILLLFGAMIRRYRRIEPAQRRSASPILLATLALALGDSFHLVPRIYRTLAGISPEATPPDLVQWIGLGLFASSLTLSFFYLFLQLYARQKFDLPWDGLMWFLVACFVLRLGLLFFPQNNWGGEPTLWKFYRNIPFTLQGAGVSWLLLRHAGGQPPETSRRLKIAAYTIIVSFVCYIATLVGTLWHPAWGSLMLPKTIAYVVAIWQFHRANLDLQ